MQSQGRDSPRTARAIYRACEIPDADAPYDRATLKIFYPALPDNSEQQRNAGLVPADLSSAPYPLVIMMPGINVGPESFAWLAKALAMQGIVTVTYSLIAEEMPGFISLTPGLDLAAITPETYGTVPSATAISAILDALEKENAAGVLKGCIDTGRTILAGHSAGGSVALYNANPAWFPQVRGAIAYGAHAAAATILGFAENTILTLPSEVPLLLIGGTHDGVIANSAHRYGAADGQRPDPVRRTFESGIASERRDSYFVEIQGANHFSLAWPPDDSTGRHFLEEADEDGSKGEAIRNLLAELFVSFIQDTCAGTTRHMQKLKGHDLIPTYKCR
ncbi:MAG: alpha/beta hydrolase family protein [Woeseiaceae bacterium]